MTTVVLGGAMLLAGCGSAASSSTGPTDDVAGLFDVGDGRTMHLECHGTGSPTIVLISGGFEAGWIWSYALYPTDAVHEEPVDGFSIGRGDPHKLASAVLPTAGTLTRVCTYDRPNTTLGTDIQSERHGQISTPVRSAAPSRTGRRGSAHPLERRERARPLCAGRPFLWRSDRRALREHLSRGRDRSRERRRHLGVSPRHPTGSRLSGPDRGQQHTSPTRRGGDRARQRHRRDQRRRTPAADARDRARSRQARGSRTGHPGAGRCTCWKPSGCWRGISAPSSSPAPTAATTSTSSNPRSSTTRPARSSRPCAADAPHCPVTEFRQIPTLR